MYSAMTTTRPMEQVMERRVIDQSANGSLVGSLVSTASSEVAFLE